MIDEFDLDDAVEYFVRKRMEGIFCPPDWIDVISLDQAYRVLLTLLDRHLAKGNGQIGWKVGLTARPIQEQFRTHEPCFGYLAGDALNATGVKLDFDKLIGPGFENELCLQLGKDLEGPNLGVDEVRATIVSIRPAFEIIETRGDVVGHLEANIPDNAQQKCIVVGDPVPFTNSTNLATVRVTVSINGHTVDNAPGANVLGDPVNSVVWLANKLAAFGRRLEAGQLIMTGSFTKQFRPNKGDQVSATFEGVGKVTAAFV